MIRPFHLRDLTLVHRLGQRGMVLQTQAALTNIPRPVRRALMHILVGGRNLTLVWRSDKRDAEAFAQLNWAEGESSAYLSRLGLELSGSERLGDAEMFENHWLDMMDDLVRETGKLGIHHLVAEAAEDGEELALLRKAGYAVYTRQDIWVAYQAMESDSIVTLKPKRSVDEWDINILYSNSVPGLIHSVEPSPPLWHGQNLILREKDGELAAYVHINPGPLSSWLQFFIHPNAHTKPREIVQAAVRIVNPSPEQPVFCCVRRYQSWILSALEKCGFEPFSSQAVLVKQIVQPLRQPKPAFQEMLQAPTVQGSSPAVQSFNPEYLRDSYRLN